MVPRVDVLSIPQTRRDSGSLVVLVVLVFGGRDGFGGDSSWYSELVEGKESDLATEP
jgi:hypothetical protein